MSCQKERIKTLLHTGCRLERGKMVNGVKMGEVDMVGEQGEARWGGCTGACCEREVGGGAGDGCKGGARAVSRAGVRWVGCFWKEWG